MKKMLLAALLTGTLFPGGYKNGTLRIGPSTASACDYCLLTQGLSPLETTRGFGFRLDGRYTLLNRMYSGTTRVANHDGEREKHFTTQLTGFYNVTEHFTVIGVLPFANRRVSLNAGAAHHDDGSPDMHVGDMAVHSHEAPGSSSSLSDISIMGRYTFFSKHNFQESTLLAFQAGLKIPTGATDALDDTGEFLDAHIQPGTGSWNFLLGFAFNYVKNKFGLSSNWLYSLNSTGTAGADNYRFGNWLNADVAVKYPLVSGKRNLFVSFGVSGEFRGLEAMNGETIANTGGKVLYAAPGLQLMLSRHFIVEASAHVPFFHDLNGGEQLGENFKSSLGINYLLH